MKKIIPIVLALLLVFSLASCKAAVSEPAQPTATTSAASSSPVATDEPTAQLPNPIVEVDGSADFADLGFVITPHQQAEDASYSIISGKIAQIIFTLDGKTFTYRGAVTTDDISGVYESFDPDPQSLDLEGPDFTVSVVVKTIDGGEKGALAEWTYEDVRYSFYTSDPTDYEKLTDVLLPILYNDLPFAACSG
ncbi:MAG: hypothetical protein ABFC56_08520 [Clostridiaceae bacterium]